MRRLYSPHFLAVEGKLDMIGNMDDRVIQKMCESLMSSARGERVSSSTEIATRPTVLREVCLSSSE